MENRKHRRIDCNFNSYIFYNNSEYLATTKNMSLGGMLINVPFFTPLADLTTGSKCEINFCPKQNSKSHGLNCEVTRIDYPAIAFKVIGATMLSSDRFQC